MPDPTEHPPSSHAGALAEVQTLLAPRWLNSPPLLIATLAANGEANLYFIDPALGERIILLDFWDYTCLNCLRALPYLRAWHERYAALGLTIIGIHSPEFDFGGERENVERAVRELDIRYPVVIDSDYTLWQALQNEYWPRKLLLDRQGQVILDHPGEGAYDLIEARMQEALRDGHPGLELPPVLEPLRPEDAPGAACHPTTPELYCGFLRGTVGNREGLDATGGLVDYADVTRLAPDTFYLAGPWRATRQSFRASPAGERPAVLRLRCRAAGVNAVLRSPGGAPVAARVTLAGEPVPPVRRGEDLAADGSHTVLRVAEPRMYRLLGAGAGGRLEHGPLDLSLEVEAGEIETFAFTFVRCARP